MEASPRQWRWIERIGNFPVTITHNAGDHNVLADHQSRQSLGNWVSAVTVDDNVREQSNPDLLKEIEVTSLVTKRSQKSILVDIYTNWEKIILPTSFRFPEFTSTATYQEHHWAFETLAHQMGWYLQQWNTMLGFQMT